jgi:hypothetical protein
VTEKEREVEGEASAPARTDRRERAESSNTMGMEEERPPAVALAVGSCTQALASALRSPCWISLWSSPRSIRISED